MDGPWRTMNETLRRLSSLPIFLGRGVGVVIGFEMETKMTWQVLEC